MPKSPIAQLLDLVEGLDAFTSHDGQAFLRFPLPITRGFSILPLRSRAFRHWCFYHFHGRHDSLPSPQAFHSLLNLLEARANLHTHGDLQRLLVGRRVTSRAGSVILDLADGDGRFVEISPGSWQVTAGPGVLLETSRSTLPLPQPVATPAGAPSPLDALRSCLNIPDRASWGWGLGVGAVSTPSSAAPHNPHPQPQPPSPPFDNPSPPSVS